MYRNFGLSFASVVVMTLSFFIVSIVGIVFFGSYKLVQHVDSKPALVAYLKPSLTDEEKQKFKEIVDSTGLVRSYNIEDSNYAKSDYFKKKPDPTLEAQISTQDPKKFFPSPVFIYSDSQESLSKIIEILENNEYFMNNLVDKTNLDRAPWYDFDANQASVIRDANKLITIAGAVITVFLFVISSVLIFITIKLTINYHRKEIEIMDLVGSDGWFIRLPFVVGGVVYGVLGALISTSIIFLFRSLVLQSSQSFVPRITNFFGEVPWPDLNTALIIDLYLATILVGALVGAISSFLAIVRYVKK
jgi:cell division transport system permease protein